MPPESTKTNLTRGDNPAQSGIRETMMTQPWERYYTDEGRAFDLANMGPQRLVDYFNTSCAEFGPRPAMTTSLPTGAEATITYQQLGEASDHLAVYLREVAGLTAGDVVAVMTANCISFAVASLAIAKAGCIATNVNPLYTAPELQHQLQDSGAKVLFIIDMFGDKVDEVIAATAVKQVVTLSVLDFYSPLKKLLLGAVLKYVRKVIPDMATPHVTMTSAIAQGRARAGGVDIAAYSADVHPDDVALYQYTSGTTGRSKGAELTHRGILGNGYQAYLMTGHKMSPGGDTVLVALPLYHITAYTLIFVAGMRFGSHSVLVPSPRPPSNLRAPLEKHTITWFTGINTLYAAMMNEPWFDRKLFEAIQFSGSGGAAQTTGVAQKWEERTGIRINQGYGMTECCGVLTLNPPDDNRFGQVGIPVPGVEIRIVDDLGVDQPQGSPGELIFRGPTMMKGYLNRPEATAETIVDGWLHTGDIAVMSEDGFFEIVDRKKDMILVSGFNVSPNEIEDVISKIPGVVQVGVIGVPDEKSSEVPHAFIVRGNDALSAEMVIATCHESLTNYKVPKHVSFVDEVPVTLSGKVLRRELRARHMG